MSALRHPSQREEMSAHCRHPERVSAKDPVIFFILNIMNKMTCPIVKVLTICVFVLAALFFQGCPYIDHGTSSAPKQVRAEDIQGCYYSEQRINEDRYVDRKLGKEKRFDRILCKEVCMENDSALVHVRGFALTYDTTGLYVEDTIPYTLRGYYEVYDTLESGIRTIYQAWSSNEVLYEGKFPVSFLEPAVDGIFSFNVMTNFPTRIDVDKPGYYTGDFQMSVSFDQMGVFSRKGSYRDFTVEVVYHYESEEVFSTKGWDICKGF